MKYKKYSLILIILVLIALWASFSFAQSNSIINGINYLKTTQSSEGYWGDASEVPYNSFVDTCTVAETLKYLNETGTSYTLAMQWINASQVSNNDYLFAKMLVLAQAGYDVSLIRDYLLSIRNDDGGWGAGEGIESSDVKRTSLALQALKAANYADPMLIANALDYLKSTQNPDGGWGFYQGDDSNVYMTAMVMQSLIAYKGIFNIEDSINKAASYLLTKQNIDGSFGEGAVYETALSFIALIESGVSIQQSAVSIQNAISYITSTQIPNGSWDDDPYSTALIKTIDKGRRAEYNGCNNQAALITPHHGGLG
jgi:squalene cyclase